MRELKIRVWDRVNKKMSYGPFYIKYNDDSKAVGYGGASVINYGDGDKPHDWYRCFSTHSPQWIPLEFSGLKDWWEGDILENDVARWLVVF